MKIEDFFNIQEEYQKAESLRILKELISTEKIKTPVLICNRKNKHILKQIIPNSYILATDLAEEKVYMVTDETIADNIREMLKYDTIGIDLST